MNWQSMRRAARHRSAAVVAAAGAVASLAAQSRIDDLDPVSYWHGACVSQVLEATDVRGGDDLR